jgi:hypothetical protein
MRVKISAPVTSGGSFRRHFHGTWTQGENNDCTLEGEYVTDETATALFFAFVVCSLLLSLIFAIPGAIQLIMGNWRGGGELLLFAAGPVLLGATLAAIYRVAAHAALESQELIHEVLVRVQRDSRAGEDGV